MMPSPGRHPPVLAARPRRLPRGRLRRLVRAHARRARPRRRRRLRRAGVGHPRRGRPEAALAARKGEEHEHRYLERLREQHPTIVEIARADPEGADAHPRRHGRRRARSSTRPTSSPTAGGLPRLPLPLPRQRLPLRRLALHPLGHQARPLRQALLPGPALRLRRHARGASAASGPPSSSSSSARARSGRSRPATSSTTTASSGGPSSPFQRRWDARPRARPRARPELGPLGGRRRAAARRVRPPEPGRQHHPRPGAPPGGGRDRDADRAGRLRARSGGRTGSPTRCSSGSAPRPGSSSTPAGYPQPLWQHRPPVPEEPRRGLALLPPPSDGDVFFDMEGFPYAERGLEYLFGAVTVDEVTPVFHDWWAHDEREERAAFEGFIDWVVARRRRDPTLHIYHYASYEETARQAADGQVRHPRGRGGRSAAARRLRGPLHRRAAGIRDRDAELLAQGRSSGSTCRRGPGRVLSAGGSVVEYQRWIDSGEPRSWQESPILKGIRDYNRVDCESTWGLRSWLLERQRESGIAYLPDPLPRGDAARARSPSAPPRRRSPPGCWTGAGPGSEASPRAAGSTSCSAGWSSSTAGRRSRCGGGCSSATTMTVEERYDDPDCLGGLDPDRDAARADQALPRARVPLRPGAGHQAARRRQVLCRRHQELKCEIVGDGRGRRPGRAQGRPGKSLPDQLCLIPNEFVGAEKIKEAVARYAEAWERGEVASQAVDDLLRRRPPRIAGHDGGAAGARHGRRSRAARSSTLVARLDREHALHPGPARAPGKTYTAAAIIVELLRRGKRVGVTAHSHKVILNLMRRGGRGAGAAGTSSAPLYKVRRATRTIRWSAGQRSS